MKNKLHTLADDAKKLLIFTCMACFIIGGISINAQTLMHQYDFDDLSDGTCGIGFGNCVDPTALGGAAVDGSGNLVLDTDGEYLTFDGTALNLSSYSAITMEYLFKSNDGDNTGWTWTSYFGGNAGTDAHYTALSHWNQEFRSNYNGNTELFSNAASNANNDGVWHHIVTVLTATELTVYRDGILMSPTVSGNPVTNTNGVTTIGTAQNYLGKGSDAWADPTWLGTIDFFYIYDGVMDASTVADRANSFLDDSNAKLATLTYSTGTLYPAFDPNTTGYGLLVDSGTASVDIDGTTDNASATIDSGTGTINLTGDAGSTDIVVTAADGVTTRTYTITINSDCFTPTYPSGNMVANPSMIGPFTAQTGFDQAWTNFDTKTDTDDACGTSFGSLYLKGTCFPDGGVLIYNSGVAIKPNTEYRILAQVKNEEALSSDVFNFVLPNSVWDLEDTDSNAGTDQYLVGIPTGTGWVQFDQTIMSGPNATGDLSFLIMSCDSADSGLITDFLYIDHFEVYDTSTLSKDDFKTTAFKLYPNPSNGGDFSIQLNSAYTTDSVNVKVYSLLGKELLNENFTPVSNRIDVKQDLSSGLYLIKVDNKEITKLLVK